MAASREITRRNLLAAAGATGVASILPASLSAQATTPAPTLIRFDGFGQSSLDIQIRIYAKTREWNDFYAVREDVMLRIKEIVEVSGTSFAFPSSTLYVARDGGLDAEKGDRAKRAIAHWRKERELPFPRFSARLREGFDDSLRYPPPGSPDADGREEKSTIRDEPLAATDEPLGEDEKEPQGKADEQSQAREQEKQ